MTFCSLSLIPAVPVKPLYLPRSPFAVPNLNDSHRDFLRHRAAHVLAVLPRRRE